MALKYTVEKLNSLDKETIIQLVLEQMAYFKRHRFGRSSERHEVDEQISFMEHNVKVKAGKKTDRIVRASHPESLLNETGANMFLSHRFTPVLYRYILSNVYYH